MGGWGSAGQTRDAPRSALHALLRHRRQRGSPNHTTTGRKRFRRAGRCRKRSISSLATTGPRVVAVEAQSAKPRGEALRHAAPSACWELRQHNVRYASMAILEGARRISAGLLRAGCRCQLVGAERSSGRLGTRTRRNRSLMRIDRGRVKFVPLLALDGRLQHCSRVCDSLRVSWSSLSMCDRKDQRVEKSRFCSNAVWCLLPSTQTRA